MLVNDRSTFYVRGFGAVQGSSRETPNLNTLLRLLGMSPFVNTSRVDLTGS